MPAVLLFVYGSLMRAGRHHAELSGSRFLGAAETAPGYAVVSLGDYPALVPTPGAGSVVGELFELPEERLASLDAFEGEDYERAAIPVCLTEYPGRYARGGKVCDSSVIDWQDCGQKLAALAYLKRSR